jgi:hypothetical protein
MAYQFLISAGAQEDIRDCYAADPYAGRKIRVLLQEVVADQRCCEALVDPHVYDDAIESVEPIWSLQDEKINAYRVRLVEVGAWRLIVAVDHRASRVGLFAVMLRSDEYEKNKPLWARIEKEFDDYGFARLP